VLAALLIVSLVFGLLLESVTTNLSNIGRARREARAMRLAEQRARELQDDILTFGALDDGTTEGVYEEPDDDLRWQVSVTPHTLDLPADYPKKDPPSPIFAVASTPPAPRSTSPDAPAAPLRMVEVRVFEADADPNSVEPFVMLLTAPADEARLYQEQQQRQQAPKPTGETGMPRQ